MYFILKGSVEIFLNIE